MAVFGRSYQWMKGKVRDYAASCVTLLPPDNVPPGDEHNVMCTQLILRGERWKEMSVICFISAWHVLRCKQGIQHTNIHTQQKSGMNNIKIILKSSLMKLMISILTSIYKKN